jgi:hypothetical protein
MTCGVLGVAKPVTYNLNAEIDLLLQIAVSSEPPA